MKRWISLRPYERPDLAHKTETEWIWINTDKIEMMEEGSPYKSVTPPTTISVGGTHVRVIETIDEIFVEMEAQDG